MRPVSPWRLLAAAALLLAGGCASRPEAAPPPDYDRPLAPGKEALELVTDPARLPDINLACYDLAGMKEAVRHSLDYLSRPSSRRHFPLCGITHERAVAGLEVLGRLLEDGFRGRPLAEEIRRRFDFYRSVGCDGRGTVLFTGYYTPIFNASLAPTAEYAWPLYRPPAALVKGEDGEVLGLQGPGGRLDPCPARAELPASGLLRGLEVAWLADPFEAYVAHVQGSAKLRLPDGRIVTAGYAGNNGHAYRSVARELVAAGKIPKDRISLQAMIRYFKAHQGEVEAAVDRNPRFVFFELGPAEPRGCLNVPVTPRRTLAADKAIFPRAGLAFVETRLPSAASGGTAQEPYTGLLLDQDAGGAIRAPGRADLYIGVGDRAGELAGQTYQEGRLWYLFLKAPAPAGR